MMEVESPRLRLSIVGIVVISLFGALFARLWYLQVMIPAQFQKEAVSNVLREISTEAPRGRILDRNGKVLVDNRTSLVVTVNQHQLNQSKRREQVLLALATELTRAGTPTKVSTIEERLADKEYNPLQPIPVAIDVPEAFQVTLEERAEDYPGVVVERELVRNYPNLPSTTAAHILGYTGRISEQELEDKQGTRDNPKEIAKPYQPDSDIGKTGVERVYEDALRGTPGVCKVEVDAKNKPVRTTECREPVPGNDLVLTIDLDAQKNLEAALALQLLGLRGGFTSDGFQTKAPAGSSVVMDPRNGQIIAMASLPTYDPSEFVNGISGERYRQLTGGAKSDNPLINRAIAGQYAPGSTFKLITANAALTQGMINANTTIPDGGVYKFGTQEFRNAGGAVFGPVAMQRAMTVSSDVFFYTLGGRYWSQREQWGNGIQDTAERFGMNHVTGVPLPGEAPGQVLTPESLNKLHAESPDIYRYEWVGGNTVQLAIGQNVVTVTPLQLANAYAMFSQHGVRYRPQIALKIVKPGTTNMLDSTADVEVIKPELTKQDPIPPNVFDPIFFGLVGVADKAQEGTAGAVWEGWNLKAWPIASKTGTAQVTGKADTSLYVAYGPANDPQYVAVAVLEEAGFGAEAAAPVVRKALEPLSGQMQPPFPTPQPGQPPGAEGATPVAGAGGAGAPSAPLPAPSTPTVTTTSPGRPRQGPAR